MFIEPELENTPTRTGCCAPYNVKKMRWATNNQKKSLYKLHIQLYRRRDGREMEGQRQRSDSSGMKKKLNKISWPSRSEIATRRAVDGSCRLHSRRYILIK